MEKENSSGAGQSKTVQTLQPYPRIAAEIPGKNLTEERISAPITNYDLCFAWNWELDADFAMFLDQACRTQGLSLLKITPENIVELSKTFLKRQMAFQVFLDRASDTDLRFMPIVQWAREYASYRINPYEKAIRTWDKTTMHLILIDAGLYAPYTIILPPYKEQSTLPPIDLSPLGKCFIIKPSHGGGGDGVLMEVTLWSQVLAARQEHPADKYLLQFHIVPTQLGTRAAWFRVLYCAGKVYPCWWDIQTHVYTPVTADEEAHYALRPLHDITATIARLCELDLFSTEISLTPEGRFVVVDYVNDQIDLRLQSKTPDGVPDEIVQNIAESLAGLVATYRLPSQNGTISVRSAPVEERTFVLRQAQNEQGKTSPHLAGASPTETSQGQHRG